MYQPGPSPNNDYALLELGEEDLTAGEFKSARYATLALRESDPQYDDLNLLPSNEPRQYDGLSTVVKQPPTEQTIYQPVRTSTIYQDFGDHVKVSDYQGFVAENQ